LKPSCAATVLHEGVTPEEVVLHCRAFNGTVGRDHTFTNMQPYNFTKAIRIAMFNTAYNVAKAVLPVINTL
jgi:hypothetical protein